MFLSEKVRTAGSNAIRIGYSVDVYRWLRAPKSALFYAPLVHDFQYEYSFVGHSIFRDVITLI